MDRLANNLPKRFGAAMATLLRTENDYFHEVLVVELDVEIVNFLSIEETRADDVISTSDNMLAILTPSSKIRISWRLGI